MKNFKIGDKLTRFPLIQGGMGVGISLGRLAGTVAKEGGIGIISTAQIGYREKDFDRNTEEANQRAILSEMKKAAESELQRGGMRPSCWKFTLRMWKRQLSRLNMKCLQ